MVAVVVALAAAASEAGASDQITGPIEPASLQECAGLLRPAKARARGHLPDGHVRQVLVPLTGGTKLYTIEVRVG